MTIRRVKKRTGLYFYEDVEWSIDGHTRRGDLEVIAALMDNGAPHARLERLRARLEIEHYVPDGINVAALPDAGISVDSVTRARSKRWPQIEEVAREFEWIARHIDKPRHAVAIVHALTALERGVALLETERFLKVARAGAKQSKANRGRRKGLPSDGENRRRFGLDRNPDIRKFYADQAGFHDAMQRTATHFDLSVRQAQRIVRDISPI